MPEIMILTAGILLKVMVPENFQIDEQKVVETLSSDMSDNFRDMGMIQPGVYGVAMECDPKLSDEFEDKVILIFTRFLRKVV